MTDVPPRPAERQYGQQLPGVVHSPCHSRCLCHKPVQVIAWWSGDPLAGLPAGQPYTPVPRVPGVSP